MSDYIVTGKKGNGKSLIVVGKIRDALLAGLRVATNLNLNLEKLLPPGTRNVQCYRLPDYPTLEDMESIGMGSDKLDESTYGLIALDEMAVWMNSREFGDKQRLPLLKWFVHSRKKRWDCFFICQNINQLDKQFREALADHHVICRRLDKLRIPFLGVITKHLCGFELRPPKVHMAAVRYGLEHNALITDRWTYRGIGLYAGYDTEQAFDSTYDRGVFSYLSPWHVYGRHRRGVSRLSEWLKAVWKDEFPRPYVPLKPRHRLVVLLAKLPPAEQLYHWHRLDAAGAFQ